MTRTTILLTFLLYTTWGMAQIPLGDYTDILLHFPETMPPAEIMQVQQTLNALQLGITPVTKIRYWRVPGDSLDLSGLNPTFDGFGVFIQGYTTGQAETLRIEDIAYRLPPVIVGASSLLCDYLLQYSKPSSILNSNEKVKIAIIDSGVNLNNTSALYQAYLPNHLDGFDLTLPPLTGSLFPLFPEDENGHGTQVASVISKILQNAALSSSNIELLPYKVVGPDGSASRWNIFQAIDAAILADADILNISLGYGGSSNEVLLQHALETANEHGIFIVTSMGNGADLIGFGNSFYPASLPVDMLRVGGAECTSGSSSFMATFTPAAYTNYGDMPNLVYAKGTYKDYYNSTGSVMGTSYAAAAMTAVVAQLKLLRPVEYGLISNARIRCAIQNSLVNGCFYDINTAIQALNNCTFGGFNSPQLDRPTPISKNNIEIHPNPSTGQVSINIAIQSKTNGILRVSNLLGQTVFTEQLVLDKGTTNYPFDISDWEAGVYIVQLEIEGKLHIQKLLKS